VDGQFCAFPLSDVSAGLDSFALGLAMSRSSRGSFALHIPSFAGIGDNVNRFVGQESHLLPVFSVITSILPQFILLATYDNQSHPRSETSGRRFDDFRTDGTHSKKPAQKKAPV
jgi:hypothetical protein